jgi:hypothetical protein
MSINTEIVIKTLSEQLADKFKFDDAKKKRVFEKIISLPNNERGVMYWPVIVYVKNSEISDIKNIIYITHRFISLEQLETRVKKYQEVKDDCEYGFKLEENCIDGLGGDLDFLMNDLLIDEIYKEFANKDSFLYLVFDKRKNNSTFDKESMIIDVDYK